MGIYIGTTEPKSIYVGTTAVKEVYVGTTKVRPSTAPLPYDNIYVFNDGVFGGTYSNPRANTIYSNSNIRAMFYDRSTGVLWLGMTNGLGYYDFSTNTYTSLFTDSMSYDYGPGQFVALKDYLVFTPKRAARIIYSINRSAKTLIRSISYSTSNYSETNYGLSYNNNYDYMPVCSGYLQTYLVSLNTGTNIQNIYDTNYHNATPFNGRIYIGCESGSNGGYIYNRDGTYIRLVTASNCIVSPHLVADSGLIDKVKSTDYEYDRAVLGPTRYNSTSYVFNGTSLESTLTGIYALGVFVKYDDNISIIPYDYDQNSSYNYGFQIYNHTTDTRTQISYGRSDRNNAGTSTQHVTSITQDGYIGQSREGIFNPSGSKVYSNTDFIGAFSKNVFN